MHHSNSVRRLVFWSSALSLMFCGALDAQEPTVKVAQGAPRTAGLIVPIGTSQKVQMTSKKIIARADNPKPGVARIQAVHDDPKSILITGLEAGVTQITLTDDAGGKEIIEVIVQFDVEYLRSLLQRIVPTAAIQPIPGANGIIILTGTVARAEDVDAAVRTSNAVVGGADRVINALRVGGVMQVQLDAVVAKVDRTEARSFGFNLLGSTSNTIFASTVGGVAGSLPTIGTTPPSSFNNGGNGGQAQQTTGILTGGSISAAPGNANLFFGITGSGASVLNFIQALRNEQLAKILSRPTAVTLSGRPVSLLSGGEQAVPVPAGLGQIGVQFEEFGTRLNCLPIVLGNGKIRLEVETEVSNLNAAFGTTISGATVPGRDTQRVHTTVEMEDGQSIVIGGLIQRRVDSTTNKVPVLGDMPFIGAAFSTKTFTETESELVMLITPHLIDAMSCDQAPKILPGQETRSPDDFELFLEGILEAPRGPRVVCPNYRYVPAFKNGPTSALFPCAGDGRCGAAGCSAGQPGGCSQPPATGTAILGVQDMKATQLGVQDAKATQPVEQTPRAGLLAPLPPPDAAPTDNSKPASLPPTPMGQGEKEGQQP